MEKGCVSLQTVSNPGDTVRQFKSAAGLRDGGLPPVPPRSSSKSQGNNKKKSQQLGLNVKELVSESDCVIEYIYMLQADLSKISRRGLSLSGAPI